MGNNTIECIVKVSEEQMEELRCIKEDFKEKMFILNSLIEEVTKLREAINSGC